MAGEKALLRTTKPWIAERSLCVAQIDFFGGNMWVLFHRLAEEAGLPRLLEEGVTVIDLILFDTIGPDMWRPVKVEMGTHRVTELTFRSSKLPGRRTFRLVMDTPSGTTDYVLFFKELATYSQTIPIRESPPRDARE